MLCLTYELLILNLEPIPSDKEMKRMKETEPIAQIISRRLNKVGLEAKAVETELLYNGISYYKELKN